MLSKCHSRNLNMIMCYCCLKRCMPVYDFKFTRANKRTLTHAHTHSYQTAKTLQFVFHFGGTFHEMCAFLNHKNQD